MQLHPLYPLSNATGCGVDTHTTSLSWVGRWGKEVEASSQKWWLWYEHVFKWYESAAWPRFLLCFLMFCRLGITHNNITGAGLVALAESLRTNLVLSHIYIWGNKINEASCVVCLPFWMSLQLLLQRLTSVAACLFLPWAFHELWWWWGRKCGASVGWTYQDFCRHGSLTNSHVHFSEQK